MIQGDPTVRGVLLHPKLGVRTDRQPFVVSQNAASPASFIHNCPEPVTLWRARVSGNASITRKQAVEGAQMKIFKV